jgi:hypothetical protein
MLIPMLHQPVAEFHQVVVVDFIHEAPSCPFLKLPEGLSMRLQRVRLKRDLYAVQPRLDSISNRDSFSFFLQRIGSLKAICGVFKVPLFRPCSLYRVLEIPFDSLLALLAALRPHQVELARTLCFGWCQLLVRGSEIATPTPTPFEAFDSFSNAYSRVSHTLYQYSFRAKASIVWDKFGTSPRKAINRALMNHLGRVGSDTGSLASS